MTFPDAIIDNRKVKMMCEDKTRHPHLLSGVMTPAALFGPPQKKESA